MSGRPEARRKPLRLQRQPAHDHAGRAQRLHACAHHPRHQSQKNSPVRRSIHLVAKQFACTHDQRTSGEKRAVQHDETPGRTLAKKPRRRDTGHGRHGPRWRLHLSRQKRLIRELLCFVRKNTEKTSVLERDCCYNVRDTRIAVGSGRTAGVPKAGKPGIQAICLLATTKRNYRLLSSSPQSGHLIDLPGQLDSSPDCRSCGPRFDPQGDRLPTYFHLQLRRSGYIRICNSPTVCVPRSTGILEKDIMNNAHQPPYTSTNRNCCHVFHIGKVARNFGIDWGIASFSQCHFKRFCSCRSNHPCNGPHDEPKPR